MEIGRNKFPTIRLLGICASPRNGNSYFLLEQAISAIEEAFGDKVETELYHIAKRRFAPCDACGAHRKTGGECRIKDDFQSLRDKWLKSHAILYSLPVYHMSVPAQLKCFIDRLGNTQGFYYQNLYEGEPYYTIPRLLKALGIIVQGSHLFGGQEKAMGFMIDHALLMRCIPVPGDLSESYTGVAGWTGARSEPKALDTLLKQGDRDTQLTVNAAKILGVRVVEMAMILSAGIKENREIVKKPVYSIPLKLLENGLEA